MTEVVEYGGVHKWGLPGLRTELRLRLAASCASGSHPSWEAAFRELWDDDELRRLAPILLRCVLGNPARPVAFAPGWRTSTAVELARTMYVTRDFAAMPILADALQDAGCDDPSVLAHCRGPKPHVRGCWVVDHVLGKR